MLPELLTIAHFVFIPVEIDHNSEMIKNIDADKFVYWTIFNKMVEVGDQ